MKEAVDKLYDEIEKNKENFLSQPIGNYLIGACSETDSEDLREAVMSGNKNFKHCLNYILNYAFKNAVKMGNKSCSGFPDNVIYAKAAEYYLSNDIPEEDIKGFDNETKAAGFKSAEVKVAEAKISSDEQTSVLDLMGDDNDEQNEEAEEDAEEIE